MASATIIIQQNDGNQIQGSREDLVLGVLVTLLNQNDTGVVSRTWQMIDRPAGSSAALSSSTAQYPTFVPDVEGTYLIKLTINSGLASDQVGAAIKTANLHYRIPAASEDGEFDSIRGWASAIDYALNAIDDGYGNLLNSGGTLSGTGLTNQVAIWNGSTSIFGDPSLTLNSSYFNVGISSNHITSIFYGDVGILADIDTFGPSGMSIGAAHATSINIGHSSIQTSINGDANFSANVGIAETGSIFFNTIADTNWKQGINLGYTKQLITGNSLDILVGNNISPTDGFTIGNTGGASLFELTNDSAYFAKSVSISNASPTFKFDMLGGAIQGTYGLINMNIAGSATETGIQLSNTTAGGHTYTILSTGTGSGVGFGKFVIGDGTSGDARFTIDGTGNIGIGTTAPSEALDVNGHIRLDGYTINLSDGATTNQALIYNGTSFIASDVSSSSNSVIWSGAKTWSDVYVPLIASGGGTILVDERASNLIIPAGAYDLSNIQFVALNGASTSDLMPYIEVASDVTIDAGGTCNINITGVYLAFDDGLICAQHRKPQIYAINAFLDFSGRATDVPMFPLCHGADVYMINTEIDLPNGQASSCIELDGGWDAKFSAFGNAKILGSGYLFGGVGDSSNIACTVDPLSSNATVYSSNISQNTIVETITNIALVGPSLSGHSTLTIQSGSANDDMNIDTGVGVGTNGILNLGAINAEQIILGRVGKSIHVNGNLLFTDITASSIITPAIRSTSEIDIQAGTGGASQLNIISNNGTINIGTNAAAAPETAITIGNSISTTTFAGIVHATGNVAVDGYVKATAYYGVQQHLVTDGSVSINTQLGEMCLLDSFDTGGGSNGNITSITLSAGQPGQIFTLDMFQGNDVYTWPTTIINARLVGGSFTKSSTAQNVDTITFRWNNLKTRWDEISRAMNIS